MKPSESPTFCPLLWLGASHWQGGVFSPCCQFDPDDQNNNREKQSFWRDGIEERPYKIERKMLAKGLKPSKCRHCWMQEDAGVRSLRTEALDFDWWKPYVDVIDQTTGDDGSFKHQPVYFDLRLGTKCNLACRMCSPTSSSLIEKEIDDNLSEFQKFGFQMQDYAYAKKFVTTEQHIDQVFDYIQTIDKPFRLKFTGGEPFLNARIPDFIDNLIDSGKAKNIDILFITNLTTVKRSLLEKIQKNFKRFSLSVSMEGVGDAYEYIRYPSTWEKFQRNAKMLDDLKIEYGICYTGNSLTIGNFIDWLDWVVEHDIDWDFNPVLGPPHYNISCLPADLKQKIIKDIKEWRDNHPDYPFLHRLEGAINWLNRSQILESWEALKNDTKIKDSIRKQSIHKSIPKLAAYF